MRYNDRKRQNLPDLLVLLEKFVDFNAMPVNKTATLNLIFSTSSGTTPHAPLPFVNRKPAIRC